MVSFVSSFALFRDGYDEENASVEGALRPGGGTAGYCRNPAAWFGRWRLMAVDGVRQDMADTDTHLAWPADRSFHTAEKRQ